jgi:hypothetical protein
VAKIVLKGDIRPGAWTTSAWWSRLGAAPTRQVIILDYKAIAKLTRLINIRNIVSGNLHLNKMIRISILPWTHSCRF